MNTRINTRIFNEFPLLETERLLLRQFSLDDTAAFFGIRSNEQVMQYMDSFPFENHNQARQMIEQMNSDYSQQIGINWAIQLLHNQKLIGYIGLWKINYENVRAEIGYSLHPFYWGKGYMKEALHEVLCFGFNQMNAHGIEASVNPNNRASIALLKKIGFSKEAHFRENYYFNGNFVDSLIYCINESDF
ncbi:MAG: GNAT family N-acetyltransferase [Bacteroidales bacterium]|nr:GNAT family N-acetyltransferase [Bacteroidales bacterium]